MTRTIPLRVFGWTAVFALLAPVLHTAWVSFSPDLLMTPPTGEWSLRWYRAFVSDRRWIHAATRSLIVGAVAAGVSVAAGGGAAIALRGLSPRVHRIARIVLLVPAVVPLAALGTGLLPFVYLTGLWGTMTGLILVHATLGLPVAQLIVSSCLTPWLEELEAAARGLGGGALSVFWRVTLPLLRPALVAAGISVFILSINESMVTLFLATADNETLPAVVWPQLRFAATPLVAVASCATAVAGIAGILVMMSALRGAELVRSRAAREKPDT